MHNLFSKEYQAEASQVTDDECSIEMMPSDEVDNLTMCD